MRMLVALLALLAASIAPALAQTPGRHPASGLPALTYTVPNGWTESVKPSTQGFPITTVAAPDGTVAIAFTLERLGQGKTLESVFEGTTKAHKLRASTFRRTSDVLAFGQPAIVWVGDIASDTGPDTSVYMSIIGVDPGYFGQVILTYSGSAKQADIATGRALLRTVKVLQQH